MRITLLIVFAAFCVFAAFFCKSKDNNPQTNTLMTASSSQYSKRHCVDDDAQDLCAVFNISYPVFSGGDTAIVGALNKSVQNYLLSAVGGNGHSSFVQALDTAGQQFVQMYLDALRENPDFTMGYSTEITDTVSFLNTKVATIQIDGYSFTGGAHPNPFGSLVSYDLTKGAKPLEINDLVRDTNAVRPILEKQYKISKGLKETDPLDELVYPEMKQMPMPANVGVAKEGLRFFYATYEIAPYAVGAADVLLTWEQLGALSDKTKWLE
ncbi:MAG: PdaC/SigV domain-containing protein [Saprospiraceae bacterium]